MLPIPKNNLAKSTLATIEAIAACLNKQGKKFVVSEAGEGEGLIYTQSDGGYKNVIIDEDGDFEFLDIPKDRRKTTNKLFTRGSITPEELASML
jgi:hypothetical protein